MTKFKLEQIKKALEKLPYWQRSCFVDHSSYRHMPERWKRARREDEQRVFRGPGLVGSSECNAVFEIKGPYANFGDFLDFIGNSQTHVRDLVEEVETLRAALKETKDELDDFLCNEDIQPDDLDMLAEEILPKRADTIRILLA